MELSCAKLGKAKQLAMQMSIDAISGGAEGDDGHARSVPRDESSMGLESPENYK